MSSSDTSSWTRTRRPLARAGRVFFAPGLAGLGRAFFTLGLAGLGSVFFTLGLARAGRAFFALRLASVGRASFALGLAGLVAGCFQPLYAEHPLPVGAAGNPGIVGKLRAVDVAPIDTPAGGRLARVSVNVRNELIYDLTGGGGGFSPTHRLDVKLVATQLQVIVDINTARPDVNNYGIDSTYTLTELATGRVVVKGQTFARVSYNIPGQEQRFAGERGLRDAENRAAKEIAENIRTRLASFFVAGT